MAKPLLSITSVAVIQSVLTACTPGDRGQGDHGPSSSANTRSAEPAAQGSRAAGASPAPAPAKAAAPAVVGRVGERMDVRILGATRLGCSVTRTADSVKVLCPSPVGGAALKRIDVSEGSESVSVHDEDGTPALSIAYREGVRAEASFLFGQYYELHARWLSGDTEPEFFGVFDGVKTELDHLRPQPAAVLAWLAKASMPIEDLTLIGCEYLDDAKGATLGKFIRRVRRRANTTEVVECYPRPWRTLHWGCTVWFHAKSGDDESSVGIRGKWLEDGFTRDRLTCLAAG